MVGIYRLQLDGEDFVQSAKPQQDVLYIYIYMYMCDENNLSNVYTTAQSATSVINDQLDIYVQVLRLSTS